MREKYDRVWKKNQAKINEKNWCYSTIEIVRGNSSSTFSTYVQNIFYIHTIEKSINTCSIVYTINPTLHISKVVQITS